MTLLATPPAPAPASTPSSQPVMATKGKSLLQKMIERYFALPQVKDWLMGRQPRPAENAHTLNTSFSYACMYYAPSFVPRGVDRYPLQKPFLDIGDFLLCHHVYDGVAVGTLFNSNEEHALSIVRDSMLKGMNINLSRRPRTRNFAVDLRVKQLEVVEFAWMEDDSLIIACRRLVDSNSPERRFVLYADMLFFEPIPQHCGLEMRYMLLTMNLTEKSVICEFCGVQGYQSCTCPNSLKRRAPSPSSSSDGIVPVRDRRHEPRGPFASAIGSWENYTKTVFSCSQTGSFFITSRRRSPAGVMEKFPGPKYPIQYRFVCGQRDDTLTLARLYVRKMRLCEREIAADTFVYGGGLSRGSDIGMILDKEDEEPQQRFGDFPPTDCGGIFKESDLLSNYVPTQIGTCSVPSQTTISQATVPCDEYGQFFSPIEMPPPMAPLQPQCTDEVSLLSTRISNGSPSSTLLDREEAWVGTSSTDVHDARSVVSRRVMDNIHNELSESQTVQPIGVSQAPVQPRPLSTTSRELQAYMTVDGESGVPKCSECGSSFQKRGNLARHIQTVHLKLKPFQCDQCPARFGYKTHLKRHKTVHQRGNEFRCNICNRDFRGQLKLNRHLQQAHRQHVGHTDGDNKIVCDACGVSFSQKSNLSRHMQIHNGFRFFCPICPNRLSSFGQKYDLQRHIQRKHPGYAEIIAPTLIPEKVTTLE